MYKKYNINELIQNIQTLKEKRKPEEEIDLIGIVFEIGFDARDLRDLAELCNVRIYDSKKFNEDFEYKNPSEKIQFKKYLSNKIEKLSGILERIGEEETVRSGRKKSFKKPQKDIKPEAENIPVRSSLSFGLALNKIIDRSDISVEMLAHLVGCEGHKLEGYLTGEYKDPSKELIEKIADCFGIDPRHFADYRKYLITNVREDDNNTLENYRITKNIREIFDLPGQSEEEFRVALKRLIGASGIPLKDFQKAARCSLKTYYEYMRKDREPSIKFMLRLSSLFDIDPHYFKEYRTNEMLDNKLTEVIEQKKKRDIAVVEWSEKNTDFKLNGINTMT